MKVSFQNVNGANGEPDGVVDEFGTVVIAGTDDNKWIDTTTSPALGAITSGGNGAGSGRTVAVGDILALVVEFDSFVAGSLLILQQEGQLTYWNPSMNNYALHQVGGTWTKQGDTPMFALGCNDGTWQYMESVTVGRTSQVTYNSASAADEIAMRFQLPYPAKLGSVKALIDFTAVAEIIVYEGTTALGTFSLDPELRRTTGFIWTQAQFGDLALTANTTYRVAVKPTTGTNLSLHRTTAQSNALFDTLGGGRQFYYSTRVDAGSWTDTDTIRPYVSLGLTAFDDGTGGSGAIPVSSGVASLRFPRLLHAPLAR